MVQGSLHSAMDAITGAADMPPSSVAVAATVVVGGSHLRGREGGSCRSE